MMRIIVILILCGLSEAVPIINTTTISVGQTTTRPIPIPRPRNDSNINSGYVALIAIAGIIFLSIAITVIRSKNLCMLATACDKVCPSSMICCCEGCDDCCTDDGSDMCDNNKSECCCLNIICSWVCIATCRLLDLCSFEHKNKNSYITNNGIFYSQESIELRKLKNTLVESDMKRAQEKIVPKNMKPKPIVTQPQQHVEQHGINLDD